MRWTRKQCLISNPSDCKSPNGPPCHTRQLKDFDQIRTRCLGLLYHWTRISYRWFRTHEENRTSQTLRFMRFFLRWNQGSVLKTAHGPLTEKGKDYAYLTHLSAWLTMIWKSSVSCWYCHRTMVFRVNSSIMFLMTHPNKSETVVSKQQTKARPVAMAEIQKRLERDVPNLSRRTSPRIADPALDSSKMAFMICTSCCTLSGDANWKITAFTAKREAKFAATVICAICWGSKVVPHQVSHTWFKHETQYIYILLSCIIWIFLFSSPKMSGHVGNNSPAKPPQRKVLWSVLGRDCH